jgi:UDP-N-acetyl-D-glucosamine/UDP-N-acetyl-D-galactosamine dehydrogenase
MKASDIHSAPVAIVGLGYVGLPLAIEFGKIAPTIGFDINTTRVERLKRFQDTNQEHDSAEMRSAKQLKFTSDPKALQKSRFIIIAVPTPVDESKKPDLSFVESASRLVGQNLKKGTIVVFEPTVYPGVTEDICVPILRMESGLKYGTDFKVGYSPERINPGDKEHTVANIVKIVSGCDEECLDIVSEMYEKVVKVGVFRAASIKTAEAAKVIENTQRDLNIALVNELSLIFNRMGVDTRAVIDAAGSKWNFHKYYPGLVGGHCIGVDPYYLTHKAEQLGYHPQVILAGRRINDHMGKHVAEQTVKHLIHGGKKVRDAKVMVLGITFKENVTDIRNSRVIDVVYELAEYGIDVRVSDPHADPGEVKHEFGIELHPFSPNQKADAIIFAVNHAEYKKTFTPPVIARILANGQSRGIVVDVKGMFEPSDFSSTNLMYWRL